MLLQQNLQEIDGGLSVFGVADEVEEDAKHFLDLFLYNFQVTSVSEARVLSRQPLWMYSSTRLR